MPELRRRELLARVGSLAALACAGWGSARRAHAADLERAFDAKSVREALQALGANAASELQVVLDSPEVAEDGAVVPVAVDCKLAGAREIFIVAEANPNPLCVHFTLPAGTDAFVSTRVKLASSTDVYAVVRADSGLYWTRGHTKVVVGGCG